MTRDYWRKKAVREHAASTGRTYLDAAHTLDNSAGSVRLASDLYEELAAGLRAAGWPVQIEPVPQAMGLHLYAGPATISVERATEPDYVSGDEHPDDPDLFDLTTPLRVLVWAPLVTDYDEELGRVAGLDAHHIVNSSDVAGIIDEIDRVVGQARQRDHTQTRAETECGICGDRYPASALFEPGDSAVRTCPACVFDGDLFRAHPAKLAFQIDQADSVSVAVEAGWAGPRALLGCLGGRDFHTWLTRQWRMSGSLFEPRECWGDPGAMWIWLPPADQRPAALAELGCGAHLARICEAIDRAHPHLRALTRAHCAEEMSGYGEECEELDAVALERVWRAAIAYAVAFLTHSAQRPSHRGPWHVMESFELAPWIDMLDCDLDDLDVEFVLTAAIPTIRDALDPRNHLGDAVVSAVPRRELS
ncbi:hypothetical protein [Nocardia salmonicida]|uniref:hypothetical protein n=1 Tax=Nocardia salmonicida TaxID=53431 RepID=UPI0007A4E53D|nr:hypothetical protein [Nocardia salmonicida]MBC7299446.1 hypothetical protein [Nocardia sp.]